jgi:DNA-binding transcriptional LysR family regulator
MVGPRYIEIFMAVLNQGSHSAAARRLGVSQPAVSKAMAYLEQRLGIALFARVGGRTTPTEAARRLAPLGQRVLDQEERVRRVARGLGGVRSLTIATAPGYSLGVLPRVVRAFNRDRPEIALDIQTMTTDDLIAAIRGERVDFGLAVGAREETGLVDHLLAMDEVLLLTPRDHPLADRGEIGLSDLAEYAYLGVPAHRPVGQLIVKGFRSEGLAYQPSMIVDAFDLAVQLCDQGVAPALASRIVALNARAERIALVRLRPAIRYAVVARQRQTSVLSEPARRFITLFQDAISLGERTP